MITIGISTQSRIAGSSRSSTIAARGRLRDGAAELAQRRSVALAASTTSRFATATEGEYYYAADGRSARERSQEREREIGARQTD